MSGAIRVLLPPTAAHVAPIVLEAGCIPVVDATFGSLPDVCDGAWVRTRPGRPAPGSGPVILAELGAPVPDRETWLETALPREVPAGYAGLVLKGREAGGPCGEEDGLVALALCPDPSRVILDAGCGPRTAAAAASLGAAGVLLVEPHLGCPELALPPGLERRLSLADDEITRVLYGIRVCASPTAPVLRRLLAGEDPWTLQASLWSEGDPTQQLWLAGQGLALARGLAERYGTLTALLAAYREAWASWQDAVREARVVTDARPVGTAAALTSPGTAATTGGAVGSAVLWEEAAWLGRPVHGGPARAAAATGCPLLGSRDALDHEKSDLPTPPPAPTRTTPTAPMPTPSAEAVPAVAIVGIGCRFPGGAEGAEGFWKNIVGGVYAIDEVPHDRWDPALYFDEDHGAPDKTYAKIGGFLKDFRFDSKKFRIPPSVARQVDPVQQITLVCVAEALADAGLKVTPRDEGRDFPRDRTAVILGNSLGGEVSDEYAIRLAWPDVARRMVTQPPFCDLPRPEADKLLADLEEAYKRGLPIVDEDSMPGELANVIAGRIANAFDLGGANFTVDAACASSMAALQTAVKSLQDGESDIVVTGGADRSMNIATYVKFCKIGALSPDHSSPFDQSANGFVMGEGCGILVLKRNEDAVRDGDRIYAVIRGIGASSDGKGKGITAPNIQGQIRALTRAYEAAGIEPWQVDLIEAHGTSTVVGDKVEVEALSTVIGPDHRGDRGPVRIGSVKSMIGHLKSAAGAASVIKAALALYHGVLPPSLNFRSPSADVRLDVVPLRVQERPEPWPESPDGLRRAGVSAFGFGGTNFHIVLESFSGQRLPASIPKLPPVPQPPVLRTAPAAPRPAPVSPGLPDGIWAASGLDDKELLANLKALADGQTVAFNPSAPLRLAAAPRDAEERADQLKRAIRTVEKGSNPDLLRARGIAYEDGPFDGKLALTFTGQGSQYLDMGLALASAYPIVAETFAEADRVLAPTLGRGITDYIRLAAGEDADAKSDVLRQTEYSQPATLTLDVAILRLLAAYGVLPDLVAGHSLGEYGAAVAAGVMTFEQALLAVSARGREMASIHLEDPGKMAGIATGAKAVEEVLAEVDGYVIPANKNCPTQTVIAGASDAVDEACERFRARGVTVYLLPVSHAFHSAIVAPASDPLRGVLAKLGLEAPKRPITTNVTGDYYPSGAGAVDQIIDLLARQISGPVEWTAQMERMYADGARVFVECGPKRALSGFTVSILKRRPHRALYTNHPKRGDVGSFRDSLAGLVALGLPVRDTPLALADVDLFGTPEPRRATTQAITAFTELHRTSTEATPDIQDGIVRIVAKTSGYEPEELDLDYELEADLGIDTVKQAEVFSVVRSTYGIPADPDFSFSQHRTLRSLIAWAANRTGATRISVRSETPEPPTERIAAPPVAAPPLADAEVIAAFLRQAAETGLKGLDGASFARALLPAVQGLLTAAFEASRPAPAAPVVVETVVERPQRRLPGAPWPVRPEARIVCSGASIGLPGGSEVFGEDNFARILAGEGRISHIGDRTERFLELGLVRLIKDPQTGQGSFLPVQTTDEVIRLAGTEAHFDLSEWGIDARLSEALDITTQLAFAAGLDALRDAGIPLVRSFKLTASGKRVPMGWGLPEALRDGTGVIFGSAFPGYDQLVRHLNAGGRDEKGHFDRRFLFQVLAMGHSQFAQLIGARGPNTAINAACASSTQALALAEDWIRMGRCERVIVLGADDVTSDALLPWIGGGFMAAGAASTHDIVEETALPFDRRRHGLVLGMGAVAMVIEDADVAAARGVVPLAEQLGAVIVNSAFHGTRLDVEHIASTVKKLIADVCEQEGISPAQLAEQAFFMSHETYTPARGGSAAAEIEALRAAFGEAAASIVVSNTKGFTGHPMGAGIEDGVVVKALQYGIVPPVANLREPDEELGDLKLSRGERGDFRYALRLAAGFGSQLALTVHKAVARGDERVSDPVVRLAWLKRMTGFDHVAEVIEERTLRVIPSEQDSPWDLRPRATSAEDHPTLLPPPPRVVAAPVQAPPPVQAAQPAVSYDAMLAELITVVAAKTGYEPSEIEADFELEADLGVDTVKQAEILGDLTERHGIERDDAFRIADYPTLAALAGYLMGAAAGAGRVPVPGTSDLAPERVSAPRLEPEPEPTAAPAPTAVVPAAAGDALKDLLEVVATKTGYAVDELEPDFELEADLGIDTVKQAEILGELTERYGMERDEAFRLSDYPTLEKLAGYLSARQQGPGPAAPTPTPTPAALAPRAQPAAAPDADVSETLAALVAVVAEKTGYEPDELDPTFELEADLGVDTVKQAEILGALQETFGLERDDDFRPADHPTLEALAAYLHSRRSGASEVPWDPSRTSEPIPTAEVPWQPPPEPKPDPNVLHHDDSTAEVPLTDDEDEDVSDPPTQPSSGRVWVAEEFDLGASKDADALQASHVPLPASFRLRAPALRPQPLTEPREGLLGVSVHVLGDGAVAAAVRQEVRHRGGTLEAPFQVVVDAGGDVLKSLARARDLDTQRPRLWIAVTRLGGIEGIDPGLHRALSDGAAAGFAKSIGREWDETTGRVLDLHPTLEAVDVARILCDELDASETEVFIGEDQSRSVMVLRQIEPPPPAALDGDAVILLTGGARGITARVAEELARRGRVQMALVGRSGLPEEPLDEKAAKARIKADLKAAGERVTPARVEAALAPLRKGEEARATIERLRALGATVAYMQADLASPEDTRRLVEDVTRTLGPITLLVHGAGVEESRLVADKDEVAFHRVFDGKAVGGRALLESIPADAFAVCMGSVAGRFGNPGQVDYAAANDALARMCHTRPRSLQVDWTAWDDVGMAVRGGMKSLLEGRGVDLLPADAGACLLANLVAAGVSGELVVAGRLGDFEPGPDHPLLDTLEVVDGVASGTRAMSRERDPWLADHAIEGTPVLPGVVGVELMVAVAAALFPGGTFSGARNVQFSAPVKIHHDHTTTLLVEAERQRPGEARARLISVRTLRTGRVRRVEHFAATVIFAPAEATEGLPSAFLPDESVDKAGIYRRFFHGPGFQVLTSVLGVSADGLIGEATALTLLPGLHMDPLVLEAAFQAAGLHRMIVTHEMGLPMGIEEVVVLSRPEADAPLSLMVQVDGDHYHIDVDGVEGPVMRVRGFSMVDRGPVPPEDRFPEPDEERPACFPRTSRSRPSASGPVVAEAFADEDPAPWLTDDELTDLRERGTARRVRDRVAGRLAAKRALAELTAVDPLSIRVWSAPSGEPLAEVPGHPSVRVSLSHREGRAIAVAVDAGYVGVDLERVEPRPASFSRTWFDDGERAVIGGEAERETIAWALKEAVLKLVGTGMACSPHDVKVRAIGPRTAEVEVIGEAREHLGQRGGGPLRVSWASAGADEVVVTVRTAA